MKDTNMQEAIRFLEDYLNAIPRDESTPFPGLPASASSFPGPRTTYRGELEALVERLRNQ